MKRIAIILFRLNFINYIFHLYISRFWASVRIYLLAYLLFYFILVLFVFFCFRFRILFLIRVKVEFLLFFNSFYSIFWLFILVHFQSLKKFIFYSHIRIMFENDNRTMKWINCSRYSWVCVRIRIRIREIFRVYALFWMFKIKKKERGNLCIWRYWNSICVIFVCLLGTAR